MERDIPSIAFLGQKLSEEDEKKVPDLKLEPEVIKKLIPTLKEEAKEDLEF
ncbi:MAG: hypothetical protein IPK55_15050 [Streptococcus sp.]|nr:hypothetical protein [Streptococcus sp.]